MSTNTTIQERTVRTLPGGLALLLSFGMIAAGIWLFATGIHPARPELGQPERVEGLKLLFGSLLGVGVIFMWKGMFTMAPNESRVLQLFGRYVGTVRDEGWRWGNPIEIAAIVVWKVVDPAHALFSVESYSSFVAVQAEAAVRNLATHHPYDGHDENLISLRGHTDAVAEEMQREIQNRCKAAGIEVIEARIAHLAYAPEIAQAMLQRQQAGAIIAARQRIVEGAVGMVEMALTLLSKNKIVELDEERKAAMVSNLLVVLCGERSTQPVINTGTLHQG
jgi:regulator of protease activity HflC (stomatin/prohibitin superfamily)